MDLGKKAFKFLATLFVVGCVVGMMTPQLSAQAEIPEGSTIDQAVLSVYALNATFHTVTAHRITADWGESSVTWNTFGGSYDAAVIGSFTADGIGWKTINVTALVQAWVDGTYPNFGILLKPVPLSTGSTHYNSSEAAELGLRPKLEIWYTAPNGASDMVTIQRPGDPQDGVADTRIQENDPNLNTGNWLLLLTGIVNDLEKHTLVRFMFTLTPPNGPGTGTPGYWKNHPGAWPVDEITIGGVTYSKAQAIAIMKMKKVDGDKTHDMFNQLVSAKLNVLIGNSDSCIADMIIAADEWMATYGPVGSGVAAGGEDSPWRVGEPIHGMLDKYNNGELGCAQHRD